MPGLLFSHLDVNPCRKSSLGPPAYQMWVSRLEEEAFRKMGWRMWGPKSAFGNVLSSVFVLNEISRKQRPAAFSPPGIAFLFPELLRETAIWKSHLFLQYSLSCRTVSRLPPNALRKFLHEQLLLKPNVGRGVGEGNVTNLCLYWRCGLLAPFWEALVTVTFAC